MNDVNLYEDTPEKYSEYIRIMPDMINYLSSIGEVTKKHIKKNQINSLEFCSGPGDITQKISEYISINIASLNDINSKFLEIAKTKKISAQTINIICEDILTANLPTNQDLIISSFAYHHMQHKDKKLYVQKAFNCLNFGGIILLGEVYLPTPQSAIKYYDEVLKEIPKEKKSKGLINFLKQTGKSTNVEYKVSKEYAEKDFREAGFTKIEDIRIWPNDLRIPIDQGRFLQLYKKR